jgi:hypothetical protein
MLPEWLTRRLTVEEAEEAHAVSDERLGPDPVPFGFLNGRWRALLEGREEGDELWEFRSPPETWEALAGREGIALVRGGEIVDVLTTRLS